MIGVICKEYQKPFVIEFFQLFKVPWEFYVGDKSYDVVIISGSTIAIPLAKLVIVFGTYDKTSDIVEASRTYSSAEGVLIESHCHRFPVYQQITSFKSSHMPLLRIASNNETIGIECVDKKQRVLRIGYDLFDEIGFLLTRGQPVCHARIPTLEIHVSTLREWIQGSGLPLVEIPPRPRGYDFTVCLTHDVDFITIREHKLDRSVLGFIARVLFPRNMLDSASKIAWHRIVRNWKAIMSLPGAYLGLSRDTWYDIDRYMELEKGVGSTFFSSH
jgi:hypothetical protein